MKCTFIFRGNPACFFLPMGLTEHLCESQLLISIPQEPQKLSFIPQYSCKIIIPIPAVLSLDINLLWQLLTWFTWAELQQNYRFAH